MDFLDVGELEKRLIPYDQKDERQLVDSLLTSYHGSDVTPINRASNPGQYGVFVALEKTGYTSTLEALTIINKFDDTSHVRRGVLTRVSEILKDMQGRANGDFKKYNPEYLNALYLVIESDNNDLLESAKEAADNVIYRRKVELDVCKRKGVTPEAVSKEYSVLLELAQKLIEKTKPLVVEHDESVLCQTI